MENQNLYHKKYVKEALFVFLIIVCIFLSVYLLGLARNSFKAYDYIGKSPEYQDRITIESSSKVTVTPDIAQISIGVLTEKYNVVSAQEENTKKMNAIIDSLKDDYNIDESDIKTSNYQINPRYSWQNDVRTIVGYDVSQSVIVKVRDFDVIGDIVAKAGELGANDISGPSFTIDDLDAYKEEAREEAIDKVKAKAETLADQLGIKLGPIVNFSESYNSGVHYGYYDYATDSAVKAIGMGGAGESAPSIEAGSQEINVTVYISYEIL